MGVLGSGFELQVGQFGLRQPDSCGHALGAVTKLNYLFRISGRIVKIQVFDLLRASKLHKISPIPCKVVLQTRSRQFF
jgi:hypothetical protein